MTRMVDPERPRDDNDFDDERFEDEGRRSIFSALWFRAILVVIVLGVVAAVAVPYVLEVANQPAPPPKTAAVGKPETAPLPAPPPAPIAPPAPPVASVPAPPPMQAPAPEKSPAADKPSESSSSSAPMAPAADKPAPEKSEPSKNAVASKGPSSSAKESASARASRATTPSPAGPGDYFVQVGAFKNPDTAKKVAARLREQKYNVEETSASAKTSRAAAPSAPAPATSTGPSDRYDVYVSGAAPADINAKLSAKGLSAEPSGAGVVVKPSMPLRDAVGLSKDLAVDGLKVQVRRAAGGPAPGTTTPSSAAMVSDGTLYRVRVGPFDDKSTATSTLRELEQKGYTPFIARGGQ